MRSAVSSIQFVSPQWISPVSTLISSPYLLVSQVLTINLPPKLCAKFLGAFAARSYKKGPVGFAISVCLYVKIGNNWTVFRKIQSRDTLSKCTDRTALVKIEQRKGCFMSRRTAVSQRRIKFMGSPRAGNLQPDVCSHTVIWARRSYHAVIQTHTQLRGNPRLLTPQAPFAKRSEVKP
jgi:hypothetical protein